MSDTALANKDLPLNPRRLRPVPPQQLQWRDMLGFLGRANMGFGGMLLHVYNQILRDEGYEDQYDQPVLVESPGAVVVAIAGDKVGFVQNFRLVGDRPLIVTTGSSLELFYGERNELSPDKAVLEVGKEYVKVLLRNPELLEEMIRNLGRMSWEVPAGIAPGDTSAGSVEEFVKKMAKLEASEEAGFEIADVEVCGTVNFNPTFFTHGQHIVRAALVGVGGNRPEDRETIGSVRLFSRDEIHRAVEDGTFDGTHLDDGKTLSALVKVGYFR